MHHVPHALVISLVIQMFPFNSRHRWHSSNHSLRPVTLSSDVEKSLPRGLWAFHTRSLGTRRGSRLLPARGRYQRGRFDWFYTDCRAIFLGHLLCTRHALMTVGSKVWHLFIRNESDSQRLTSFTATRTRSAKGWSLRMRVLRRNMPTFSPRLYAHSRCRASNTATTNRAGSHLLQDCPRHFLLPSLLLFGGQDLLDAVLVDDAFLVVMRLVSWSHKKVCNMTSSRCWLNPSVQAW